MSSLFDRLSACALSALLLSSTWSLGQRNTEPRRIWSVGPLVSTASIASAESGSAPHADSQTESLFRATRSVVFAGDRIVVAVRFGPSTPRQAYRLYSLDLRTGEARTSRDLPDGFGLPALFPAVDNDVIVSGRTVLRLTPELKDDGNYANTGRLENVSPDGHKLGMASSAMFQLLDTGSLSAREVTRSSDVDTSVSNRGFITDNDRWRTDYPNDRGFVTYTDGSGSHLLYHGRCGGKPQFLSDDLILEQGCRNPEIIDINGELIKTLSIGGNYAYAGVARNSRLFALQVASFDSRNAATHEHFVIFSTETWRSVGEVTADYLPQEQSWTAFSPDGSLFAVGSAAGLTLYRMPDPRPPRGRRAPVNAASIGAAAPAPASNR